MINKFQTGGKQTSQGNDAIVKFVQALAGVLKADPQQVIQIAQQNPEALKAAVQVYQKSQNIEQAAQAFSQAVQQTQATQQQQTVAARHGAKLNYLKSLKNQCPEGQEPYYYKKGGMVKCGCSGKKLEDGGEVKKENAVTKFKKIRKAAAGTTAPQPKPKRKVTEYEKGRTELAKDLGWGADTVHVAGKPYSLTNDKGKRLNTSYPEYGKRLYQADMKSNKKDAKARVQKADEASAYKQGSKIKKHYDGGILNLLFKK